MKQVISVERQNVGTAEVPEIELTSSGRVTIVPIDRIQPNPYLLREDILRKRTSCSDSPLRSRWLVVPRMECGTGQRLECRSSRRER